MALPEPGTVPGCLPPPGKAGHGAAHAGAPPLGTDRHLQLFVSIQHTLSSPQHKTPAKINSATTQAHTKPIPFHETEDE